MTTPSDDLVRIAREVLACASSHDPDVCLIGNVRAADIAALAREVLPCGPVRVCVLIDVDTADPVVAYERVVDALDRVITAENGFDDWDTADTDWYDPTGRLMTEDEISNARLKAYKRRSSNGDA